MATIIEDYVSFEIAKLLKEKGFAEKCRTYYKVFPKDRIAAIYHSSEDRGVSEDDPNEILCPTVQMAMKWLREVHSYYIEIRYSFVGEDEYGYVFKIRKIGEDDIGIWSLNDELYDSYEEASEAAIKHCIEYLI